MFAILLKKIVIPLLQREKKFNKYKKQWDIVSPMGMHIDFLLAHTFLV